ncbi:cell wall hydrolase [Paenibacillus sp. Marseille-Q4541]|uniref:cell wall hydrolase n=1 Tax=Paenibacillus sp. Marseille-Q4541 TaxID=2831522 RepID=UPI0020166F3A|nr:cell wall hydrolase [Paenibacillus sp. Marseille-Q4541]
MNKKNTKVQMKWKKLTVGLLLSSSIAVGTIGIASPASAMVLQKGTHHLEVVELQERLKSLGYLDAGVTGYYGSATEQAVRSFQEQRGLGVDGKAGKQTVSALKKQAPVRGTTLDQLARAVHGEARGESIDGQVAVAAVILNRVQSDLFPDSITEVILEPRQFTAVDDGQYNLTPDSSAYTAARRALNGEDPAEGALYYYNPKIATSAWSMARPAVKTIGNHIFTR